jgi:hypothetical protein
MAVNNLNTPGVGIQPSIVDAKGDLLVGTAADAISRLGVTGTTGAVLTADAGETTGLKWAAAGSVGGLVHIDTVDFTNTAASYFSVFSATYLNYVAFMTLTAASTGLTIQGRLANSNTAISTGYYYLGSTSTTTSLANFAGDNQNQWILSETSATAPLNGIHIFEFQKPFEAQRTGFSMRTHNFTGSANKSFFANGYHDQNTSYSQFALLASTGNITGSISFYGYRK